MAPFDLNDARAVTSAAFAYSAIQHDLYFGSCREALHKLTPVAPVPRNDNEHRLLRLCSKTPGRPSLRVPDVEALGVEENGVPPFFSADSLHEELLPCNGDFAGVAGLAVAGTTPDAWDAVIGQAAIGELASNEEPTGAFVHGCPPRGWLW